MRTIEIKQVQNGFVVTVFDEDNKEYIFQKENQVFKFIRDLFKTE